MDKNGLYFKDDKKTVNSSSTRIEGDFEGYADEGVLSMIQVISDPTRIRILKTLSENKSLCGKDILTHFSITQPTLSHHMSLLCDCGLVLSYKSGKYVQYCLSQAGIGRIVDFFKSLNGYSPQSCDELEKPDLLDIATSTPKKSGEITRSVNGPSLKKTPMLPTPKTVIPVPEIPEEMIIENKKAKKKQKSKDDKKDKKKKKN